MKAKKTAPLRRRISFAVDRDEIEINSDWVDAVMSTPASILPEPASAPIVHFPAPTAPGDAGLFFAPSSNTATEEETATGANSSTGEECTSVEKSSAVDEVASVVETAAVVERSPVENVATVDNPPLAGIEVIRNQAHETDPAAVDNTTVEKTTTGADNSSGVEFSSTKDHRVARPRPILRITDGLTPGQYAVYSLMYEAGDPATGSSRIYKGGYADLGRLTGLSKRGIQNIVAELQAKEVIRIHQQPGYHRTETSAYLVPEAGTVLQAWFSKGWRRALGKSKALIP